MEGGQVEFGRRGRDLHPARVSADAGHVPHAGRVAGPDQARPDVAGSGGPAPNTEVHRSLNKALMGVGFLWLVVMLSAGHTKYHNDLPFWMRPDAEFRIGNFLFPAAFCFVATVVMLGPLLRRPIALNLFDDHFDFVPLFGTVRSVPWARVGDVTKSSRYWSKHRYVYVEVAGEKRVSIPIDYLAMSGADLVDLMNYSRANSVRRHLRLSGEPVGGRYLFPGH